jgi:hypothetical protein
MKIDNSNILSEGLKNSGNSKLAFYSNKVNRSNVITIQLANAQKSLEVITPDGTWSWSIRYLTPNAYAGGGTVVITLNSQDIELNVPANQGLNLLFEKKGEPYILAKDEIIIENKLGVGNFCDFYLSFERVMFNNE